MTTKEQTPYDGLEFTELMSRLTDDVTDSAERAYAATKKRPQDEALADLIDRGESQLHYFRVLQGRYTKGKREAIDGIIDNVEALERFLAQLRGA